MEQERRIHQVEDTKAVIKLGKSNQLKAGDILEYSYGLKELVLSLGEATQKLNSEGVELICQESRKKPSVGRSLIRFKLGDGIFLGRYTPGFWEVGQTYEHSNDFEGYKAMLQDAGLWQEEVPQVATLEAGR